MSKIILHHYPLSPYSEKIRLALGLKNVTWSSVEIPVWTPRPKLTPMTGGYRKTPILQVGAEFYCDTLHILHAIEKLGNSGALYPKGQEGLAKAFGWWIEKVLSSTPSVSRLAICPASPKNLSTNDARFSASTSIRTNCVSNARYTCSGSTRTLHGLPKLWLMAVSSSSDRSFLPLIYRRTIRSGSHGRMVEERSMT